MIKDRWGYGALAVGLLLMCLCVIGNDSFVERIKAGAGRIGLERVNIGALSAASEGYGFTLDDLDKLPKTAGPAPYAYSGAVRMSASAQERSESVEAIGVGGDFFAFHQADMEDGTVFMPDAVEERIAVLDSELAWRLFRAQKISGMTFKLGEKEFTVLGVLARDESVLGSLVDIGVPRLYLPFSTLAAMQKEARVSNIEVQFPDVMAGEGKSRAETFLQALGKGASSFRITDGHEQARIMAQWGRMLVFALWFALTLRLVRWFGKRAYTAWNALRASSLRQGFRPAVRKMRSLLVMEGLCGLGAVAISIALFLLARFTFYVPSQKLPSELFDLSYYVRMMGQAVRDGVFAANYTPMWWAAYTDIAAGVVKWLFAFGVLGWIFFLLGNALLRRNAETWTKKVFMALALWILAMAISCGVVALCGLTPVPDTQTQIALLACTALFLAFAPPWDTPLAPNTSEKDIRNISE